MTPLGRLMEILNGSGEVDHIEPLGDRHALLTFYDSTLMLVVAEAIV